MRNGCIIRQKRGNGRHCGIPARSHGDEDLSTLVLGNLKGREAPNGLATYFHPMFDLEFFRQTPLCLVPRVAGMLPRREERKG